MVRVLDSGSSGPGSGPGQGHCVVFLGKALEIEILLVASCYKKPEISAGLMGLLACNRDFTLLPQLCLGETLRLSGNKMNCFPRDQSSV